MKKTFLIFILFLSVPLHAQELSLRQLEQIALKKAGLHPEEVLSWKRRVRWSALLPKIVAGYGEREWPKSIIRFKILFR